ncbi:MAG: hypothetical protein HQK50_00860 [Oligoflexia bacterium]|nr:hypothetical protein [Oligoflexia bacterium]MBF0364086.1 hypothetical protein [Oligoflexia bacterium]
MQKNQRKRKLFPSVACNQIVLFFALLLLLTFTTTAYAQFGKRTHCLVLKGADPDGAFSENLFHQGDVKILGEQCETFPNWHALFSYYKNSLKNLPSDQHQIFIVQAAHGKCGGGIEDHSGAEIIEKLHEISSTHQVAAYLDSCFSGDIFNQTSCSAWPPNLCLATTSVKGHVSLNLSTPLAMQISGYDFLQKNMEDLFNGAPDGLISSGMVLGEDDKLTLTPDNVPADPFCCNPHPHKQSARCKIVGHPLSNTHQKTIDVIRDLLTIDSSLLCNEQQIRRAACRNFRFHYGRNSPSAFIDLISKSGKEGYDTFLKAHVHFDINQADEFGRTPMYEAAKNILTSAAPKQFETTLSFLLEQGADIYSTLSSALANPLMSLKASTLFSSSNAIAFLKRFPQNSQQKSKLVKELVAIVETEYKKAPSGSLALRRNAQKILLSLVPPAEEKLYRELQIKIENLREKIY